METLLNLVWLAVTVAAIGLWRFRWTVSRRGPRPSQKIEAVAMVCFLALLFPVISLTDDLHPEIMVVDAASGKRNACLIAASARQAHAATLVSGAHFAVGMVSRPLSTPNFVVSGFVPLVKFQSFELLTSSSFGRSPPILL